MKTKHSRPGNPGAADVNSHGSRQPNSVSVSLIIPSGASLPLDSAIETVRDAAMAARVHGAIAIMALASIAADPDAPATARVAAASKLLERGYGRVPLDLSSRADAAPDLFNLSDTEFDAFLQQYPGSETR